MLYIPMALAALIFGGIVTYKKYKLYKKNMEERGSCLVRLWKEDFSTRNFA